MRRPTLLACHLLDRSIWWRSTWWRISIGDPHCRLTSNFIWNYLKLCQTIFLPTSVYLVLHTMYYVVVYWWSANGKRSREFADLPLIGFFYLPRCDQRAVSNIPNLREPLSILPLTCKSHSYSHCSLFKWKFKSQFSTDVGHSNSSNASHWLRLR